MRDHLCGKRTSLCLFFVSVYMATFFNAKAASGNDAHFSSNRLLGSNIDSAKNVFVVKGRVKMKGSDDKPDDFLPGVAIFEKGTKHGTSTDIDGNYHLSVHENSTLIFTMMGFKPLELKVNGRAEINVTMQESANSMKEIVVNGYQTVEKKLFTGSATTLKGAETKRDGISDVSRMLEGRVAGVSVQNVSGTFGAAPKIRIRGATSITGDNKPLWVVDGMVLEDVVNVSNAQLSTGDPATLLGSSVAGLNPDDIESFQILKDAAATSIYGARAMNGVVVITTKKGKIGRRQISYSSNYSTYLKPTYSSFDIMNSYDQMSVYAEMDQKGWLNYSDVSRVQNGGVYTKLANEITAGTVLNTPEARNAYLMRYAGANTDWFNTLFKNSFMQEHSLSVSSGNDNSQLYYSTSYLKDNGWTVADKVERFTGNAHATFNLSPKLTMGILTQGAIRNQRVPGSMNRQSDAVTGKFARDFDINPFSYATNTSRSLTAFDANGNQEYFTQNYAPFNILNELENNTIDLSMIDLKVQGELSYLISDNLKYSFDGSYRYAKTNQDHQARENSNMPSAYRAAGDATIREGNRFLYRNPDNPDAAPVVVLPSGGFYSIKDNNLVNYAIRNRLNWDKKIKDIHTFNMFFSQEMRYVNRQDKGFIGYGYQFDRGGVPFVDPNSIKQAVEGNFPYYNVDNHYDRFVAFAGKVSYSFNEKYNINGTLRYDGSNLLGQSAVARWLPIWNVSGSWNVDQENFMQKYAAIDRLSLRATYGLTASMGKATNSSLVLRSGSTFRPYLAEVEPSITIDYLENSMLTWEKQFETNLGLDLSLLKNRFNLTLDFYNRNGFDLIDRVRTSGIGGEYLKFANYADMNSKGLELALGVGIVKKTQLELRTQLTFGRNWNKIRRLDSQPLIWDLVGADGGAKLGYPVRGLFSIDFQKLDPENGTPLFINENGELSNEIYFQSDVTKYLKYEGPVDPTFTGGWSNFFKFRNWTLTTLLTFSGGNKVRLNSIYSDVSMGSYSDLEASSRALLSRWVLPGDELQTSLPALVDRRTAANLDGIYAYNAYNYSSQRVANGGFIRLKQVTIGYTIPMKFSRRFGLTNMSLGLTANNLWLIYSDSKLNGQDPEFFGSGGVALPMPRQFTFNLKVGI